MAQLSLGLIETIGLTAAVEAADAAVKAANVTLIGYEHAKGSGMTLVKVVGEVGSVNAAIAAAKSAAGRINQVVSTRVIARPADGLEGLIYNSETRGAEVRGVIQPQATEAEIQPVAEQPKAEEAQPEAAVADEAVEPQPEPEAENKQEQPAATPARSQKTNRKTTSTTTKA